MNRESYVDSLSTVDKHEALRALNRAVGVLLDVAESRGIAVKKNSNDRSPGVDLVLAADDWSWRMKALECRVMYRMSVPKDARPAVERELIRELDEVAQALPLDLHPGTRTEDGGMLRFTLELALVRSIGPDRARMLRLDELMRKIDLLQTNYDKNREVLVRLHSEVARLRAEATVKA
jgi:hypothetical protein